MPGNEAHIVFVSAASRDARDHLAADDDWARCVLIAQLRVGDGRVPDELSSACIKSDDMRVVGGREDLVGEDRDVPLDPSALVAAAPTGSGRPLR
jgi:hypothetical protein